MKKNSYRIMIIAVILFGLCLSQARAASQAARNYVSGIFIAPEMASNASANEWRSALQNMKRIGIDTVIVQYTLQMDSRYGQQAYFDYWQGDTVPNAGQYPRRRSQLGYILEAARRQGMKVYLGLQLAEREWFDENKYNDYDWLYHQYWLSSDLADKLWAAFGEDYENTIAGWYLPFELETHNEYFPFIERIADVYYKNITSYLKNDERFGELPIMISPLMYRADDKNAWQANLKTILSSADIDIVAPQDGIGFGTQSHSTVGDWYRVTRAAIDGVNASGRRVSMWANCENYVRLRDPNESDPVERVKPMAISGFIDSLDVAAPYADKLVTFSIHRWDTAIADNKALGVNAPYYDAYRRYYANKTRSKSKSDGYYVALRSTNGSELKYHADAAAYLTDGFAKSAGNLSQYKGVSSPQNQPFIMEIRFDAAVALKSVSSNYYQNNRAYIALPQNVKYEYLVRSGRSDEVFTYYPIADDQPRGEERSILSKAELPEAVMADGVRITVTPGGEWSFMDDIWVE